MTRPIDHTPRSAAVLMTRALSRLDRVEPPEIRNPIAAMLGIEQCVVSRSLLGKPVVNLLDLAQAIVETQADPA